MQTQRHPPISPMLVIILGIFSVSTAASFVRLAQEFTPSIVIAALRLTFAALLLAPITWIRYRAVLITLNRRDWLLGIISGCFLAVHFATWITSLEYTSVASSVVIVTTVPLWVAILSPFVLREPVSRNVMVGLILSLVGGIIVALSDSCSLIAARLNCMEQVALFQSEAALGNSLALIGALAAAGYILIGRNLRSKLSLIPYVFIVYGVSAILLVFTMMAFRESPTGYPSIAYIWIFLLAVIPQLIGHSSFNWALGYLPASYVSIALLGDPIGSIILAYIILRERPAPIEMVGAILILIGIYIASKKPGKY
jgi:drug/metabolite transporter (DMT)-like permease